MHCSVKENSVKVRQRDRHPQCTTAVYEDTVERSVERTWVAPKLVGLEREHKVQPIWLLLRLLPSPFCLDIGLLALSSRSPSFPPALSPRSFLPIAASRWLPSEYCRGRRKHA